MKKILVYAKNGIAVQEGDIVSVSAKIERVENELARVYVAEDISVAVDCTMLPDVVLKEVVEVGDIIYSTMKNEAKVTSIRPDFVFARDEKMIWKISMDDAVADHKLWLSRKKEEEETPILRRGDVITFPGISFLLTGIDLNGIYIYNYKVTTSDNESYPVELKLSYPEAVRLYKQAKEIQKKNEEALQRVTFKVGDSFEIETKRYEIMSILPSTMMRVRVCMNDYLNIKPEEFIWSYEQVVDLWNRRNTK